MDSTMTSDNELDDSRADHRSNSNRLLQLPMSRIRTIMKSSPELGNVSQEAYYLITRATECFVQYMAEEAWKSDANKKTVEYKQLANIVESDESLEFLEEIVPHKIKVSDYWKDIGYTPPEPSKKSSTQKPTPTKSTPNKTSPEMIVIDDSD